jgi:Uri superfamily endonuclease
MNGAYLLLMELSCEKSIQIGRKRSFVFPPGWYIYVGSAMNGIEQRVRRHFSSEKKIHWHIDYFLQHAQIQEAYYKESKQKEECDIARIFIRLFRGFSGFGCTDCSCESHLFHGPKKELHEHIDRLGFFRFSNDM